MGEKSNIQWTDASWNPIRGVKGDWHCTKVSEGCRYCYAEALNSRFSKSPAGEPLKYEPKADKFRLDRRALFSPTSWRPRMIFVCSMTDLFHEDIPDEWILEVLNFIRRTPKHVFQVLTKRPERMKKFMSAHSEGVIPNLWLGVSCENGETYRERVPYLALTPGPAVRFVSFEPLLEPIGDLFIDAGVFEGVYSWAIVGGESGPKARPFNTEWAEDILKQCDQRVRVFMKQLGTNPYRNGRRLHLTEKKGGRPDEWPELLRVREFPE